MKNNGSAGIQNPFSSLSSKFNSTLGFEKTKEKFSQKANSKHPTQSIIETSDPKIKDSPLKSLEDPILLKESKLAEMVLESDHRKFREKANELNERYHLSLQDKEKELHQLEQLQLTVRESITFNQEEAARLKTSSRRIQEQTLNLEEKAAKMKKELDALRQRHEFDQLQITEKENYIRKIKNNERSEQSSNLLKEKTISDTRSHKTELWAQLNGFSGKLTKEMTNDLGDKNENDQLIQKVKDLQKELKEIRTKNESILLKINRRGSPNNNNN